MATVTESMLTTEDNPYDPFTQWLEWYAFDYRMGYHTPSLLARLTVTSHELSDEDQRLAIERAMDEIVELNLSGVHKKVTKEISEDDSANADYSSLRPST